MGLDDLDWLSDLDRIRRSPKRVVSLVPSVTESLFDLNFGEKVVGITDYCVFPRDKVTLLPKVGGTKNPQVEKILALNPDLVIANREENTKPVVTSLSDAGIHVWVTFPKTVDGSLALLRGLARLFQSPPALQQVEMLEVALEWAEAAAADLDPVSYFCPVWQEGAGKDLAWWMTFNRDTYCDDLLGRLGGRNVFWDRVRQVPLEGDLESAAAVLAEEERAGLEMQDTRYPRVSPAEVSAARPEVILLPDEPFPFDQSHLETLTQELADTPAVQDQRVHLFEGNVLTWPGTRLALALRTLPRLLTSKINP